MKLLAIVGLMLFSASAFSQDKWEGYKYLEETDVTFKNYATSGIVKIETIAGVNSKQKLLSKPYKLIDVSKQKKITDINILNTDKMAHQIETCRNSGLQFCPINKMYSYSTGFFIDNKTMYSCRHVFHIWLVWASQANNLPVEQIAPPLILKNNNGEIIYNSATVAPEKLLKFSFINKDPRMNVVTDVDFTSPEQKLPFNLATSDISQMQGVDEIVQLKNPPIIRSQFDSFLIEETYIAGFAQPVKGYKNAEVDGEHIVVSNGTVLGREAMQGVAATTNYSSGGLSGSPVMSTQGEILGMACGNWNNSDKVKHPENVKAVVTMLDHSFLEDLWKNLEF